MHLRIGVLGGLSPASTVSYYERITRSYVERFGDYAYPEIVIYSVNFQQYVDWQKDDRWAEAADAMVLAIESLRRAGADFGLIATNTMHIVFDEVQARACIPLLSIVDATADAIARRRLCRVGLLGTVFTMREAFYRNGLEEHGIESLVPAVADQELMNRVIYRELCRGVTMEESRREFQRIVTDLKDNGAEGVVLGCTEIPLLLRPGDVELPIFNTALIHADAALARSVGRR